MSLPPPPPPGTLEVVVGPMFSGKTESVIYAARRHHILQQVFAVLRPAIDQRTPEVKSHSGDRLPQSPYVKTIVVPQLLAGERWKPVRLPVGTTRVAVEEAQFFPEEIVRDVQKWRKAGMGVLVTGLDMDSMGEPFDISARFLALATSVTKLVAVCVQCGSPAQHSYRKGDPGDRIAIGGADLYEARCMSCWVPR